MRTLHRAHVHLVSGMPDTVDIWIEPDADRRADVYVSATRYTTEEAERLQAQLDIDYP